MDPLDTSSYLYMSKRQRFSMLSRKSGKKSNYASNMSVDSLENDLQKKVTLGNEKSDENMDTILVPFYEKDVLMKVPKLKKGKVNKSSKCLKVTKRDEESQTTTYLVNKSRRNTTYLDMFRKQFKLEPPEVLVTAKKTKKKDSEARSISPQYGDTEQESIATDAPSTVQDFYDTEAYNEMFYDKLLNDNIFDDDGEELQFEQNLENMQTPEEEEDDKEYSQEEFSDNNLRSVSEVSQPRRRNRRATIEPMNVKLGGLGPDMESIRPRLERARSLQRYSEKVRMANRLKIYKKTTTTEEKEETDEMVMTDIKSSKSPKSSRHQRTYRKSSGKGEANSSYLMNKTTEVKKVKNFIQSSPRQRRSRKQSAGDGQDCNKGSKEKRVRELNRTFLRSASRNRSVNTDLQPPVQINFMLNLEQQRPSSALKQLEDKHRMYQERVKAFIKDNGQ